MNTIVLRVQKPILLSFIMLVWIANAYATSGDAVSFDENDPFKVYRIGKGDTLRILTWKEPELSVESTMVRLDGKITLPLINDIQAEGLSTMELKSVIENELGKFVEAPLVTVLLLNSSQKYYVMGEMQQVGEYPLTKKMTVLQAFAIAGGFTEWAAKKEIILYRMVDGEEKITRINYKDIIKGKKSTDNVVLQADDIIIVP